MSVSSTSTRTSHRHQGRLLGSKDSRPRKRRKDGEVWTMQALAARSIPDVNEAGCWAWTAGRGSGPRGRPRVNLSVRDHRHGLGRHASSATAHVAWLICQLRGDDMSLPGYHAQHICDNRWCVNPDHIWWGPYQQNVVDRMNRPGGYRSYTHKLSIEKLRTAYWLYYSNLRLFEVQQRVGLCSHDALMKIARLEQGPIAKYFAGDGPDQRLVLP